MSAERLEGSHLLRLVHVGTFSAPRSPLVTNISCSVGQVTRSVQVQVSRRHHPLSAHHTWSSEDTLLLSVSLTLLLILVTIITSLIVLLLRRLHKSSSSPRPVFTCTMEPRPDVSSHVSLQPRSTNVSFIDLYNPPQEAEFETKSLRTFRETHFEFGLSPPPAYSDSVVTNQRPASELWTNQRTGHTVFHCQHSCFTRPHLECS